MRYFILPLSLVFICLACKKEVPEKAPAMPNTPETVGQQWVEAFYKDDFEIAAKLGTEATKMMIDSVKKELEPNAQSIAFKIHDMKCGVNGDSAFCTYFYQEEGVDYNETVRLLKVSDQWLVNEPWQGSGTEDAEMEQLIKEELERIFEEEAKEGN